MTLRRMLLGVVGAVAVCSATTAKPPSGPLSEGRELDPVVRDFQLDEPPTTESRGPARSAEKPGDLFGGSLLAALNDAVMRALTIQLGTVQTGDIR
jgi:hypothetical protein